VGGVNGGCGLISQRQSASERALGEQQEMVASLESELEAVSHNLVLRGVEVNELQQLVKSLRVRFAGFPVRRVTTSASASALL
jgi:septal ring factor EnvC (AmiA/AmiB activator)